ncbi:IclR family transcriptional regulator [Streptomyces sp. NPDC090306]|uniref:IclR family transcriptional regulator n=1 Tax=unclassified Streptomyces TaxID=2593676 RepID=UPI0036EA20EB
MRLGPIALHHSAQDALRVLDAVAEHPTGVTGTELARRTRLGAERLVPLLRILRREGYVAQAGDGVYVTGETLARLGSSAAARDETAPDPLQRTLDRLRDTLGAAVRLCRYVDGEVRVTHRSHGPDAPAVHEWFDFRSAAHATAAGKCLLGQLDDTARRDHLARHRPARLTSRTITGETLLLSRLDAQPPGVPVLDLQEYAVGTVCAAVPVTAGSAVGSLSLSLPVEQAHRLRRAADTLNRNAARVLLPAVLQPLSSPSRPAPPWS